MKRFITAVLMLMLLAFTAAPALAAGLRNANAAYNELLSAFHGKYPDEYAGAYLDTAGNKLCVLLTERHADTAAKLSAAQDKMLSYVSIGYRSSITFKTVKYSYNELLAARDTASALLRGKGYALSSAGINDEKNMAEIGVVPEDHSGAADFVKADPALCALPLSVVSEGRMTPIDNESSCTIPQTGSNSSGTLLLALLLISGGTLVGTAVFVWKRKSSRKVSYDIKSETMGDGFV